MATRAKFKCLEVTDLGWSKKVKLQVVYEGSLGDNEENKRFTKATPSGEIWMTIDNPAAAVQFEPQKDYYVTSKKHPHNLLTVWL